MSEPLDGNKRCEECGAEMYRHALIWEANGHGALECPFGRGRLKLFRQVGGAVAMRHAESEVASAVDEEISGIRER